MIAPSVAPELRARSGVFYAFITFLVAISGFVWVEPAPVDLLTIGGVVLIFAAAMRVPAAVGRPLLWLVLFIAANLIGVVLVAADPPARGLGQAAFFAGITFYLLLAWFFFTCVVAEDPERTLEAIWRGWVVAALLSVAMAVVGYFHLAPGADIFVHAMRGKALFKDPNVYGPFLIPPLIYLAASFERGRGLGSAVRIGMIAFLAAGVMLSFSRAALGSLIVTLLAFLFLRVSTSDSPTRIVRTVSAWLVMVLFGTGLIVAILLSTDAGNLFLTRMQLFQEYDVGQGGRFTTQIQALQTALLTPEGLGPGQSDLLLPLATHSLYVRVVAENGLLGALGFFGFLAATMWRGLSFGRQRGPMATSAQVVVASLVGVLVNSLVIDSLHWRHFFLLLAMLWGMMLAHGQFQGRPNTADDKGAHAAAGRRPVRT